MGVFSRISQNIVNIVHRFSQSFHQMKVFWVQMIELDLIFHGNQFCEKMANFPDSSFWHSDTEVDIATSMCALTT